MTGSAMTELVMALNPAENLSRRLRWQILFG
jgi:hypothetical protein